MSKRPGGSKIFHIVVSLLIAVALWAYVDSIEDITVNKTISDIPIQFIGADTTLADRGLMLLSDSPDSVTLRLQGTRWWIARLDPEQIRVQVDLSAITSTGTQNVSYRVIYPSPEFSGNITVKSITPSPLTVDIGELSRKDVEIRCDIQGKVADGYIAGEPKFDPEKLELRGQQADIDPVSYAKVTLVVDNAQETVTQSLRYTLYDENDQVVDNAAIRAASDQIQVTLPVNVVKELPLTVNFIEAPGASLSNVNYVITPKTVTISGDAAKLKNVTAIVLDDFSLESLTGTTAYNYVIPVPDGCENLSGVSRATMQISFKDMVSATLTAVHFTYENPPQGKTVEILTTELPVTLRGTSADVNAVTPENVTVAADLSGVSSASGSYTVPADIRVESPGDVGVVGTYQIRITISENTTPETTAPETGQ
jgi:YbbR domain-containing protein